MVKTSTGGVKVCVRLRPFNSREKAISQERGEPLRCIVEMDGQNCIVLDKERDYEPDPKYSAFVFDHCFWSMPEDDHNPMSPNGFADQKIVYDACGSEALTNAWEGYNTCIFAYGQTGAGKSFSMLGAPGLPGISPQIITNLFKHIEEQKVTNPKVTFKVETCFFEIYMEKVKDLFSKDKNSEYSSVKIRQHPLYGIQVQGLETKTVTTEKECADEMDYGVSQRSLASTKMNATSSRSHAIFQIHVGRNDVVSKSKTTATINLVDLAGSERIGKTGATGQTKEEGMAINLSLSTLRKVMDALVDQSKGKKTNPPYRESMLTWVLKESLGGNSKTIMITAISPHYDNVEDTLSTLRYGLKAKAIVNKAVKQETSANKQAAEFKAKVAELEEQLRLAAMGGGGSASAEEIEEMQRELQMQKDAEAHVKEELNEMEERATGLELELANAKKRAFATAFRNAFGAQKKREAAEQLEAQCKQLQEREVETQAELCALAHKVEEAEIALRDNQQVLMVTQEKLADEVREREQDRLRLGDEKQAALLRAQEEHEATLSAQLEEQASAHRETLGSALSKLRDTLEREREELKERMSREMEQTRAQLAERKQEASDLQQRVEELEPLIAELDAAKKEAAALRQKAETQAEVQEEHRRQASALQSSYEQLAAQSERDAAHHRQRMDDLRAELAGMRRERDQFRKQVLTLQVLHSADSRIISAMSNSGSTSAADVLRSPSPAALRAALPVPGGPGSAAGSPRRTSPPLHTSVPRRSGSGADYLGVYRSGSAADYLGGRAAGGAAAETSWRERLGGYSAAAAYSPSGRRSSPRRAEAAAASISGHAPPTSPPGELRGVCRLAAQLPSVRSPRERGAVSAGRLSGARSWSPSPRRSHGEAG